MAKNIYISNYFRLSLCYQVPFGRLSIDLLRTGLLFLKAPIRSVVLLLNCYVFLQLKETRARFHEKLTQLLRHYKQRDKESNSF